LFPREWIKSDSTGVLPAFLDYATPLIGPIERQAELILNPPKETVD